MSCDKLSRPHLIEEYEGANHLALVARQSTTDFEAFAQIAHAWNHDEFERVTRSFVAEDGIGTGHPAHYKPDVLLGTMLLHGLWNLIPGGNQNTSQWVSKRR